MNFGFTEEQELLRAEVRKFLDRNAPMEEVRKIVESEEGWHRDLWKRMAELGWVGLVMPEEQGGMGLDYVTLLVLLEETGRSLFPSPLIPTVLAARAIEQAGTVDQQADWLPGLAAGASVGTFALIEQSDRLDPEGVTLHAKKSGDGFTLSGKKHFVPNAGSADLFVVAFRSGEGRDAISLAVLDRDTPGLTAKDQPGIDLSKRVGTLDLDGVEVPGDRILGAPGAAWPLIAQLLDVGTALVTAEAVGAAEQTVHITTEFAKQRIQFGEPIGRFQGVKHPLAEMYVDVESFKSLVYYAMWALDEGAEDASLAVSRAKAYASDCFPQMGIDGVQLHGGVGYTWEYDVQLYLKRGKWLRPVFGDADHHYERIATLGGL